MGRVVDGHGDLRAEHVVLDHEGVTIVDRLEFDPRLRCVDVADDLAFLVMDLHALGAGWVAQELVDGLPRRRRRTRRYRTGGGFGVYRALVRTKIAFLRPRNSVRRKHPYARRSAQHLADVPTGSRGPLAGR